MSFDNEVAVQMFIEESREHLGGIEDDLLTIETEGENAPEETVNKVFRAIHTIKGGASFFAFTTLKNLSHVMENILDKFRSHELPPTPEIVSVLLDSVDCIQSMINDLEHSENIDISHYVKTLESFLETSNERSDEPEDSEHINVSTATLSHSSNHLYFKTPSSLAIFDMDPAKIYSIQQAPDSGPFVFLIEFKSDAGLPANEQDKEELINELSEVSHIIDSKEYNDGDDRYWSIVCSTSVDKEIITAFCGVPAESVVKIISGKLVQGEGDDYLYDTVTFENGCDQPEEQRSESQEEHENTEVIEKVEKAPKDVPVVAKSTSQNQGAPTSSLRVNIEILDQLMTLAGELVLTRNELVQHTSANDLPQIITTSHKVNTITSELQEAIMHTRMQSVGFVFNKFRRIVRDLARQLNKQIHFEIEGEDVELDKSIIEAIGDPLTHVIRNAIDHGIESSDVRTQAGKSAEGTLCLKAKHEAGQVIIEISDDGKGIDPAVIRKKLLSLGMVDATVLAAISDRDVIKYILKPGFSTAEEVTDISGRGVGMDVVQSNLSRVGGVIDIDSVPGSGTTLRIKLPLTLAIIPSLLVIVEGERYAIPQVNLVELVRIPASEVNNKMEHVGGAAVMRLRGELLPVVHVADVLGIKEKTYVDSRTNTVYEDKRRVIGKNRIRYSENEKTVDEELGVERRKSPSSAVNVVVVAAGDYKYGLVVDSLLDSSEIVVKPLGCHLYDCRVYAGATILGDGHVALILDVIGINTILEIDHIEAIADNSHLNSQPVLSGAIDSQSFLIVENGEEEYFAIPIGLISRIERILITDIKNTGGEQVFQYGEGILRLYSIEEVIECKPRRTTTTAYAIIFQIGGRDVSVIASEIVDTIEIQEKTIDTHTHLQTGIIGSTVNNNCIILMLDLFAIARFCSPDLSEMSETIAAVQDKQTILIVEDSPFFLKQICSFIQDAGYETLTAEDGIKGLAVLKNHPEKIDLIITDIEMPHMNGYEMTRAIRADENFNDIPIIAVTSVIGKNAREKGIEAGMNEYLIKLERNDVINACKQYLEKVALM